MPDAARAQRLVDESLFVPDAAQPTLRGAACDRCNTTTFPYQESCPRCGGTSMAVVPLPRAGTLWSFTVQNFEPKPPYRRPENFEPYGVGYVDLGPVIVEARLRENDVEQLSLDLPVELVLVPAFVDDDGTQVVTFGFAPAAVS